MGRWYLLDPSPAAAQIDDVLRRAALVLPLLVLACVAEPVERAPEAARSEPVEAAPVVESAPSDPVPAPPTAGPGEPEAEPSEEALTPPPIEPQPPAEPTPPSDPLIGEVPSGPEPGSPESDAELLALLDESTLTQEEFAKAFGSGKDPKLGDDEQFVFGAGERSRERSKVGIGAASVSAGKVAAADVEALARDDVRDLEVCHAMALSKDAAQLGRVTLTLELGAGGAVDGVKVESKLSEALNDCLASVADGWTLDGGSKATVKLPLTLSTQ
jgi:hypothetical protein